MFDSGYAYGGFNSRRKRNLYSNREQSRFESHSQTLGIDWDGQKKRETQDSDGNMEGVVGVNESSNEITLQNPESISNTPNVRIVHIGGKEVRLSSLQKKAKFEETHIRFTSYLKKDLHEIIQELKRERAIRSVTELINDSVKHYLRLPK